MTRLHVYDIDDNRHCAIWNHRLYLIYRHGDGKLFPWYVKVLDPTNGGFQQLSPTGDSSGYAALDDALSYIQDGDQYDGAFRAASPEARTTAMEYEKRARSLVNEAARRRVLGLKRLDY